jgi:hypothetical protein
MGDAVSIFDAAPVHLLDGFLALAVINVVPDILLKGTCHSLLVAIIHLLGTHPPFFQILAPNFVNDCILGKLSLLSSLFVFFIESPEVVTLLLHSFLK